MPNYFQLFKKGTYEAVNLSKLDEEICREVLHTEPHPKKYGGQPYVFNWFDSIGFIIATDSECYLGSQKLRDQLKDWDEGEIAMQTLTWLEQRYSSSSGYMAK